MCNYIFTYPYSSQNAKSSYLGLKVYFLKCFVLDYAGLSFNIDEIVQAWNEMYDAKKLKNGSSSFRLEPMFRRRPSKLHNMLEHIHYT